MENQLESWENSYEEYTQRIRSTSSPRELNLLSKKPAIQIRIAVAKRIFEVGKCKVYPKTLRRLRRDPQPEVRMIFAKSETSRDELLRLGNDPDTQVSRAAENRFHELYSVI